MRKASLLTLPLALLMGLLVWQTPASVQADAVPFSVVPIMPATQLDTTTSYYDVVVAAGQTTQIQTRLINKTAAPVKVNVQVVAAQTSDNGALDYSLSQKRDPTLQADLADHLHGPATVTLPAKGSRVYTATLSMPALDGLMAGGLVFTPAAAAASSGSGHLAIVNRYHYAIALIARNARRNWSPSLTVSSAQIRQDHYRNTLAVPVHDPSGAFVNGLRLEVAAKNQATGQRYTRTQGGMQMAPHSHFYYRLALPDQAAAGTYAVTTTAYYGKDAAGQYQAADGTHYRYKLTAASKVTLTATRAKALSHTLKQAATGGHTPWIIYALGGLIAALALTIAVLVTVLVRRRKH